MGAILKDVLYALNQRPLYIAMFPIGRIHGYSNQGAEAGVAQYTIVPNGAPGGFVLLIPLILGFARLVVLGPKGSIFLLGEHKVFTELQDLAAVSAL